LLLRFDARFLGCSRWCALCCCCCCCCNLRDDDLDERSCAPASDEGSKGEESIVSLSIPRKLVWEREKNYDEKLR
jgi:hypothetical protein